MILLLEYWWELSVGTYSSIYVASPLLLKMSVKPPAPKTQS